MSCDRRSTFAIGRVRLALASLRRKFVTIVSVRHRGTLRKVDLLEACMLHMLDVGRLSAVFVFRSVGLWCCKAALPTSSEQSVFVNSTSVTSGKEQRCQTDEGFRHNGWDPPPIWLRCSLPLLRKLGHHS